MSRTMTVTSALRTALAEEMERDERVFVMGEDVGFMGGVFGETQGLQKRFGQKRVFDTGVSETLIVGAGVGAAITGLRPVVELQFADFYAIAMDEIANKAARWRWMHGGHHTVPLVILSAEGALKAAGPEHSQCPEALFYGIPGIYVLTPATPYDVYGLLKSAIRDDNPVFFLTHHALGNIKSEVPDEEFLIPLGKADVKREGTDVTVVAWSRLVILALEAADRLSKEGVSVEVIDPRGTVPLDMDTILNSVRKTGKVVLAHEAPKPGGPGSEVAARIAEEALEYLEAPIKRVTGPFTSAPQSLYLEQFYLLTADDVANAVRSLVPARTPVRPD